MASETYIPDYEDTEPPSRPVLRVSTSGGLVFLSLCEAEQDNKGSRYKPLNDIAVSLGELLHAIDGQRVGAATVRALRPAPSTSKEGE